MFNKIAPFIKTHLKQEVVIMAGAMLAGIFIFFYIFYGLPSPYSLKDYQVVPLATHIYDRNGKLLYEIYHDQKRTAIKLKDLPKYVSEASIAVEDKDFYHHQGISLVSGMLRAVKDMILTHSLQGGSTITQQLVKNALLTSERTIRRKIREVVLALWTEKVFTKDQILEMYLNQVPYGGASYGIEEAAKTYYDKDAKDLSLAEASLLAGLPQAPSFYSPYSDPDLAITRRNEVLKAMLQQKYITQQIYDKTIAEKISVKPPSQSILAPHFVFYIKSQLEDGYGIKQVEEGGLNVITTLDYDIQSHAEQILKEELDKIKELNVSNGAILVTRPATGEILSMVGSVDYFATPSGAFNVTTALRQPGSSIKPINYAIGLERHLVTASTPFLDVPTCFPSFPKSYCPINYDGQFHGIVQMRFALGNSFNIPAVKMLALNGVDNFVASSSAFMITTFNDPSRYGLSLTLGGGEVRMTEMAQAFSTFANRGTPKRLKSILEIKDRLGNVLVEDKDPNFVKDVSKPLTYPNIFAISGKKVVSEDTAFVISHILLDNNARQQEFGASSALVIPGKAVSVKTGTTDDKKDNWTIGYTPNFLTTVWVGNDDNTPMNPYLASGITGAAPIWNRVMTYVLKNQPDLWPIKPETVLGRQVCSDTGAIANKADNGNYSCPTRFEYFIKGTENYGGIKVEQKVVPVSPDDKMVSADTPGAQMKPKNVATDGFSQYCLDCAGDKIVAPTPTPHP